MNGCKCNRRYMGNVLSLPCRECRMSRTTTYQCDNPSCCEMVERPSEWWHVRIAKGSLDFSAAFMFGEGYRHDLCFCSPGCMEFALRCIELTEIARDI